MGVEADLERVNETLGELVGEISELLVPPEKYDQEDAVVEVVPGAGGVEASLFAEEIFNLYLEYTRNLGFEVEVRQYTKFTAGKDVVGISKGEMSVSGHQVLNIIEMRRKLTKLRFLVS